MPRREALGLDELMIVNPGRSNLQHVYLGADGRLYAAHAQTTARAHTAAPALRLRCACGCRSCRRGRHVRARAPATRIGELFLGSDGAVYELVR